MFLPEAVGDISPRRKRQGFLAEMGDIAMPWMAMPATKPMAVKARAFP